MYRRDPIRWRTRFGRWVSQMTVSAIVDELNRSPDTAVTPQAVYDWLNGRAPRPERARALVQLSGGEISLDDIYSHRAQVVEAKQATP